MFDETMKLVLGWSIVSAFIVTTIFTLMSLVGWIRFASRKQQQGLYAALILEVVVGGVAGLRSPAEVRDETAEAGARVGRAEGVLLALDARLASAIDGTAPAKREELLGMIDLAEVPPGTPLAERRSTLRRQVEALPEGSLPPRALEQIRGTEALRRLPRAPAPRVP